MIRHAALHREKCSRVVITGACACSFQTTNDSAGIPRDVHILRERMLHGEKAKRTETSTAILLNSSGPSFCSDGVHIHFS